MNVRKGLKALWETHGWFGLRKTLSDGGDLGQELRTCTAWGGLAERGQSVRIAVEHTQPRNFVIRVYFNISKFLML